MHLQISFVSGMLLFDALIFTKNFSGSNVVMVEMLLDAILSICNLNWKVFFFQIA